jgi:hypothetical protein
MYIEKFGISGQQSKDLGGALEIAECPRSVQSRTGHVSPSPRVANQTAANTVRSRVVFPKTRGAARNVVNDFAGANRAALLASPGL